MCGYVPPYDDEVAPLPYHDANNGERNRLYRNEGSWNFEDVTALVGLEDGNQRFSFAASWEDLDNDGDPDLYVANDFGRNNLYLNERGRFTDVAQSAGVEDISAGMGVTFSDYDRDGRFDIHVSNMFSSAGKRVTYERRLPRRRRFGHPLRFPPARPGATRSSQTLGTGLSSTSASMRESPWVGGPGALCSLTSTTTGCKTYTCPTASSPARRATTICEASSGGRSCRAPPPRPKTPPRPTAPAGPR